MSYRVGTPNYNLPQTEGTDKRDWSDTNQAFLTIDTAIKNAIDTSASASSAAATAQQTADGANTAATHAQTDATTAQTLATTASELAQTAKTRADSAYTRADNAYTLAEGKQDDVGLVKTVTGNSYTTWASLVTQLFNGAGTLKPNSYIIASINGSDEEFYTLASIPAKTYTCTRAFQLQLRVRSIRGTYSSAAEAYIEDSIISSGFVCNHIGTEYTSNVTLKLYN